MACAQRAVQKSQPVVFAQAVQGTDSAIAASNLALEVPAYCAAARSRLKQGWSLATVRSTVLDDMRAAMSDAVDSTTIDSVQAMSVSTCWAPYMLPSM